MDMRLLNAESNFVTSLVSILQFQSLSSLIRLFIIPTWTSCMECCRIDPKRVQCFPDPQVVSEMLHMQAIQVHFAHKVYTYLYAAKCLLVTFVLSQRKWNLSYLLIYVASPYILHFGDVLNLYWWFLSYLQAPKLCPNNALDWFECQFLMPWFLWGRRLFGMCLKYR